ESCALCRKRDSTTAHTSSAGANRGHLEWCQRPFFDARSCRHIREAWPLSGGLAAHSQIIDLRLHSSESLSVDRSIQEGRLLGRLVAVSYICQDGLVAARSESRATRRELPNATDGKLCPECPMRTEPPRVVSGNPVYRPLAGDVTRTRQSGTAPAIHTNGPKPNAPDRVNAPTRHTVSNARHPPRAA